jgi:cytochrome c-type biogenesis protein CcsB
LNKFYTDGTVRLACKLGACCFQDKVHGVKGDKMSNAEITLFWITIFSYTIAFCFHLIGFVSEKPRGVKFAFFFLWLGLIAHSATAVARWVNSGHPPVTDTYELNLTGTWFTVLMFLVFEKIKKVDNSIGLVVTPIVFLLLGQALIERSAAVPMGPSFQSPWLVVHVIFAWLSFGCYAIATGAAVFLLMKGRFTSSKALLKVPDLEALDLGSYRFIVIGFINHAVMLVSGAIWAKKLWGKYWSWDVLETWSLISFLVYAFYLHARSFLKWKMERAAWLTILALLILAISYWGVDWFAPTVHPGP